MYTVNGYIQTDPGKLQVRVPADQVERCALSSNFKMQTTQVQKFSQVAEGVYKLEPTSAGGRGVVLKAGKEAPKPSEDGRITLDDFESRRVKGPERPQDRADQFRNVRSYSTLCSLVTSCYIHFHILLCADSILGRKRGCSSATVQRRHAVTRLCQ